MQLLLNDKLREKTGIYVEYGKVKKSKPITYSKEEQEFLLKSRGIKI